VVEASLAHGSFDTRWPSARQDSSCVVPTVPASSHHGCGGKTRLERILQPLLPRAETARHGTAYGCYTQGREGRESQEAGTRRLLAAIRRRPEVSEEGLMVREKSELERRRDELTRSLQGLSNNQADAYRRNSDALALDRAGVKHERPEEMVRLGEAELAADAAIRDAQRELRDIDAEIKLSPRRGFGARLGRAARRARAER
jgi:hypothetical protein